MYLHVPAAWLAYLAFGVTALASALFLWPRTRSMVWDRLAGASAELGVLFTALTLVLGSLWGKPVWGIWWAWDARLVTTAVLFFLYLGYLALRRIPSDDPIGSGKRNAIAALIAFVDVPIVHFSVEWWRTLHQKATVFNPQLDAQHRRRDGAHALDRRHRVHDPLRVPARPPVPARRARGRDGAARGRRRDRGSASRRPRWRSADDARGAPRRRRLRLGLRHHRLDPDRRGHRRRTSPRVVVRIRRAERSLPPETER